MNESWDIREPTTFWEFREKLSNKMVMYKPMSHLYQGDDKMRVSVAQILNQQTRVRPKKCNDDKNTINLKTLKGARKKNHRSGTLCGDLYMFQKHVLTKGSLKNPKAYEVCDIDSYTKCCLCKTSVHYFPHKFGQKSQKLFFDFHSDNFFGLARKDVYFIEKKK